MSNIAKPRVGETTTVEGTGAATLLGAMTAHQRFSAVCSVADTVYYDIEAIDGDGLPTGDWEEGIGTYSSANTLTRTTPQHSSNAGAAVVFTAGTKRVRLILSVEQMAAWDAKQAALGFTPENVANKDTDGTLAANSDTKYPSQKAVKTYADQLIAAADAMVFRGVIDCSANPNYPAADAGATYRVSVAGKIGGASGVNVEAGDLLLCLADSTASGNQATVGASWSVAQTNLDGAVIGPTSAVNNRVAFFDGVTGKLIKDSGLTLSGSNTGDQTSIVGITGSVAEFNTALTGGDFLTTAAAVTVAQGGTGRATLTANSVLLGDGTTAVQMIAPGTSGNVLTSNGTTWASTAAAGGGVGDHYATVESGNGHGSTNTKIRRFTTLKGGAGTGVTYADSATLGATFTINEAGMYEVSYSDASSSGATDLGISINSNQLTTNITGITAAHRYGYTVTAGAQFSNTVTRVLRLAVNDVVRPHTTGTANTTVDYFSNMTVRKVGAA